MTDEWEAWMAQAVAEIPDIHPAKLAKLKLLFTDQPPVLKVLRAERDTPARRKQSQLHNLPENTPLAV